VIVVAVAAAIAIVAAESGCAPLTDLGERFRLYKALGLFTAS